MIDKERKDGAEQGKDMTGGLGVLSSPKGVRPGLPEKAAFGLKLGWGESELCRDLGERAFQEEIVSVKSQRQGFPWWSSGEVSMLLQGPWVQSLVRGTK